MPAPAALDSATADYQRSKAEISWWQSNRSFAAYDAARGQLQSPEKSYFLLGDEVLEVAVDEPSILDSIREYYGDCELSNVNRGNLPLISCVISTRCPSSLIAIQFLRSPPLDLAPMALGLSHPPRGARPYAISDARQPGWSLIGGSDRSIIAVCRTGLLVDPGSVADDFVADFLVAAMLSAQNNLIVLHAAALQVGSGGAILTGASHAGKTTTSMHLASRGHRLLGDEITLIRLGSREISPLPRSVSLRAGPRSSALASVLQRVQPRGGHSVNGKIGPLRINELFSVSGNDPVSLKAAFFLNGFSEHPAIEPFNLTLNDETAFDCMSANDIASITWGLNPQRRALRLLALKHLMGHLRCWKLRVGPPDETAKMIERTMEER